MRTLSGIKATKTSGVDGWNSQVYSVEGFAGGARASARATTDTTSDQMFGLNTDPLTDASFTSIDYAWYLANSSLQIYEFGSQVAILGAWVPGELFEVTYSFNGTDWLIQYWRNGALIRSVAVSAGQTFYFDSSFYSPTKGELLDLQFGPNSPVLVNFVGSANMTLTGTPQRARASAARVASHMRVEVTDADGTWRDVSTYLNGPDFLNRCSIDETLDGSSQQFSLTLLRDAVASFQILNNPEFADGLLGGYNVYDNGSSGSITLSAEAFANPYNRSGYRMKVAHTAAGTPNPGIGGFYVGIGVDAGLYKPHTYHKGAVIFWKIIADVPVGYDIQWAQNPSGNNGVAFAWLTPTAGIGAPKEYIGKITIGTAGPSFSTIGYFYLQGTHAAVNWYVYSLRAIDDNAPLSLAPLRTDSATNRQTSTGLYAPILDLRRRWRAWLAPLPADVDPLPGDYEEMGNGFIDRIEIDDESPTINATGRDSGAVLLDAYIRTERSYGSIAGTPIASVLQSMIDDNATDNGYSGITLTVDASAIAFSMNLFTQKEGGLMQALNVVAGKAGMVVRYRYNASDQLVLTLYSPNRAPGTIDWSIGPDEYLNIPLNTLDIDAVRNLVVLRFFDTASATIMTVQSPSSGTSASITKYGLRPMFIDAAADSGINSAAKAQIKADAVRLDLETPALEQQIVSYNLWFAQLGDYARLLANAVHYNDDQFGGVISIHHEFAQGSLKSTIGLKGKPAGRYRTWLAEGQADVGATAPPPAAGAIQPPTARVTQSATSPPTLTVETLTLDGWSNRGAAGDLLLMTRWRIIDSRTGLGAFSAWVNNAGINALPLSAAVTRGLKWKKTFEWQVRDELGQVSTATYDINSKMDALNDSGVVDDQQNMSSGTRPFRRTLDTADEVTPTAIKGFVHQSYVTALLQPNSLFRSSVQEPSTNLFKRGTDTADDIVVGVARAFVHQDQTDLTIGGGRIINVRRGAVNTESAANLFKRGTDLASDVVITSTRTFVDPNAATQVDASGRIVGVYRLGVYEPVNNLVKFGDSLGAVTMSSLTLNGAVLTPLIMTGTPTSGKQIALGDSSVWSVVGTMFSSGNAFISYNAAQSTINVDSWLQNNAALKSALWEVTAGGVALYTSAAGHASGAKGSFWTIYFDIADVGIMTLRQATSTSPGTAGTYGYRVYLSGADRLSIGADGSFGYIQTWGGQPLYLNSQGNHVYCGEWLYFLNNYGHGIVGIYDPAKYRLVYAMGDAYKMPADGTALTGLYGIFFAYDATVTYKNVSGHDLGHGLGIAANGTPTAYVGNGFWTSGEMWQGSTRVAKVMWGGGAPAGSAPTGTIYFQTS